MSEIIIFDEIGPDYWGLVSAKSIIRDLEKIGKGKPVTVRLNSPGGDVIEGEAIYNAFRRHSDAGGRVTMEIDALAASMASYVAMAGDEILIAENALLMIHDPWTIMAGNAKQLRDAAGILDKMGGNLASAYAKRSGQNVEIVTAMMAEETWLTAQEAIDKGFADAIGQPLNAKAHVRPGMFGKTPDWIVTGEPSPAARERQQRATARAEQVRQQIRMTRARLGVA